MPQMSPMLWLWLNLYFLMLFILIMIILNNLMIYYSLFNYKKMLLKFFNFTNKW